MPQQPNDPAILTVDLHEMQCLAAKKHLAEALDSAPAHIREVTVIHGYNGGTALLKMVRKEFAHPRVARKLISMNKGVTTLLLK